MITGSAFYSNHALLEYQHFTKLHNAFRVLSGILSSGLISEFQTLLKAKSKCLVLTMSSAKELKIMAKKHLKMHEIVLSLLLSLHVLLLTYKLRKGD